MKSISLNILKTLKEGVALPIPRATKEDIQELDKLGESVDPKIKEIIDRFTSMDERTAFFGNRSWFYGMFTNGEVKKDDREYIKKDIEKAFDESVKNNIQAISHQFYPYDREPGFLMIYKDNILEVCVYNSGVYTGDYTPEVMLNNAFGSSSETFVRKNIKVSGVMTEAEIDKSLLPVPEDTLTPKIDECRHILFEPEQLSFDFDNMSESVKLATGNFISELNKYRDEYSFGHSDNDSYIEERVINLLNELPSGATFYTNYLETVSGYSSWGGYSHKYAKIIQYEKDGDSWKRDGAPVSVNDVKLGVLHSDSEMRNEEDAKKAQEEMKKSEKSTHTPYAPKTSVDRENPYWDGNRYGI